MSSVRYAHIRNNIADGKYVFLNDQREREKERFFFLRLIFRALFGRENALPMPRAFSMALFDPNNKISCAAVRCKTCAHIYIYNIYIVYIYWQRCNLPHAMDRRNVAGNDITA